MKMNEIIKSERLKANLTQEELAEKLGLQKSAIAKYENGRVKNIKRSTIEKMSHIFNCNPSYLMGLGGEQKTEDKINYVVNNNEARYLIEITKDFDKESMDKLLIYAKKMKELKDMEQDM